jgi:hypothetical protein
MLWHGDETSTGGTDGGFAWAVEMHNLTMSHHPKIVHVLAGDVMAVAASFRVLLFPLDVGDALPTTEWDGPTRIIVTKPDGTRDTITFEQQGEGYTVVSVAQ